MKTFLLSLCLCSCAHTDLYGPTGRRLAHFEGDCTGMEFKALPDGTVELKGTINHSTATLAQGQAASQKIAALGAAGLVTLIK